MRNREHNFFHSRLARQTFALFVFAALLPVVFIAVLSFDHVSAQLREQSYEQSRQASKTIAMELLLRLRQLGDELVSVDDPAGDAHPDRPPVPGVLHFGAITRMVPGKPPLALLGPPIQPAPLTDRQNAHLSDGNSLLSLQPGEDGRSDILLTRLVDPRNPAAGRLVGRISATAISSLENLLPGTYALQLVGPGNRLLYASDAMEPALMNQLGRGMSTAISGHFEWQAGDSRQLSGYWTLFTQANFDLPYIVVVVSQDESRVLAPVAAFRTRYFPGLLLLMLVVALVSANRIRRKLAPLIELRDATRRVADGDFSGKIEIDSKDELAELGTAFNGMTDRLEAQFASITTMAEIDRLILSSFDTRYILATVLSRAGDLTPCSIAAVLEPGKASDGTAQLSWCHTADSVTQESSVPVSSRELRELGDTQNGIFISCKRNRPQYLDQLHGDTACQFLLLPTFVRRQLEAVIIFGYDAGFAINEETRARLRRFADHVAVALSNAKWEERLYHQAHYDTLTDLPNRALLQDRLEQAMARARRNDSSVGVMFIDLDRFKLVNDSLGHTTGDRLLQKVSRLLTDSVRSVDTVVRFGGDEFVLVIPDIGADADPVSSLAAIAGDILQRARQDFQIGDHQVRAEASIGIAVYPRDGLTPDELVKHADTAMYHAKDQGRSCYRFFAPELNHAATERLNLERELRQALENGEFRIYYQPKVNCADNTLSGAEALVRWQHPIRGIVTPSEFIPTAEETGLIKPLGDWVLRNVCEQIRAWQDAGLPPVRIAVNLSTRQFSDDDVGAGVTRALARYGLDAGVLELEVTETSVMKNTASSIDKLHRLNRMGIHLSVDDFGTGYSSLNYLKSLPLHTLKVDRSFIVGMLQDKRAEAIVSTIIVLAHSLGLSVVAEGVETEAQRIRLREWGCNEYQGYLYSPPVPASEFERFLAERPNPSDSGQTAEAARVKQR